ncbi:MAG: ABC transporter permease [Egibacteraceae bacterium]
MARYVEAAALYRRLIGARIRSQLQYRASFALDLAGMFLVSFIDFIALLVLFHNVPSLGGWSVAEVSFLYATSTLSFAFTDLVFGHVDEFPNLIRDGSFDLLLIRPLGTLFQVISMDFQLRRLGKALQAAMVLVYALTVVEIGWTPGKATMLLTMPVAGTLIFGAVWVLAICIAFWSVEAKETANAFIYGGGHLAQFPITVYDVWLRRFLAYVIPMAFVSYLPALYILDKPDLLGLPSWLRFASPVVALAAAACAGSMWRIAVRHYRSAGG